MAEEVKLSPAVREDQQPKDFDTSEHHRTIPTIRISGIESQYVEEFTQYIKSLSHEYRSRWSLAPAATSRGTNYVATVSFDKLPDPFKSCVSTPDETTLRINLGADNVLVAFDVDTHFKGMTPLNETKRIPKVDLVAVTGLAGHAFGSWKAKGKNDMWLRDFLPEDLRTEATPVRIMIYGYDSTLRKSRSDASIHEYARQFLEALKNVRTTDAEFRRPLILLGHSLGGLVIKHAMKEAARGSDKDKEIFLCCYGLLFFGVPHRGLEIESLRSMVKQQPNEPLLNNLGTNSQLLPELERAFSREFLFAESKVLSFYETKDTPSVEFVNGKPQRSGPPIRMVSRDSATYATPNERIHDQLPIDGDHSSMVKFESLHDIGYDTVRRRLHEIVLEAPGAIIRRFEQQGNPVQASKNSSSPIFHVPALLQTSFTGRIKELARLWEILNDSPNDLKQAAIYGMPGIGKSQLMLRFAHDYKQRYPQRHVLFLDAASNEKLVQGYEIISGLLRLPQSSSMKQEAQIAAVCQWLIQNPHWLLLLDNVSDVSMLKTFLPPRGTGEIIFTMRDEYIARTLGSAGCFYLFPLTEDEGVELFHKITGTDNSTTSFETKASARSLVNELGGVPLALQQCMLYSVHHRQSLQTYLSRLIEHKVETLQEKTSPLEDHSSNVYSTFMLALRDLPPIAIILLKIIVHFDHQDVPMVIFDASTSDGEDSLLLEAECSDSRFRKSIRQSLRQKLAAVKPHLWIRQSQLQTENILLPMFMQFSESTQGSIKKLLGSRANIQAAISHLHSAGLVQLKDQGSLWMHDLFCEFAHSYIEKSERAFFALLAVILAQKAFPWPEYDSRVTNALLAPHVSRAISLARRFGVVSWRLYKLEWYYGEYCRQRGRYFDAAEFLAYSVQGFENTLGKRHSWTLDAVHNMAIVFKNQGKYDEALEWYERALAGYEKVLSKEHPSTLNTVHNMASVFDNQGKYDKALEWYERALARREKALGKEHPGTLNTVNNMAMVFRHQGKYDKALEWYERALAGYDKALGKEHPSTLGTVNNMAIVFDHQGRYDEALEWYERALAGYEKALGKEHPSTLGTVYNMVMVFKHQGKYDKALEWYERALAGYEKALGKEHPSTLKTAKYLKELQDRL